MNGYPTTPDQRASLARDIHANLPEDRRLALRADDLERLAAGLPDQLSDDEVVEALFRWTATADRADVPRTTRRSGFDAVVAARARREERRGVFDAYDPRSRTVTGTVMPVGAVSYHRDHTVIHTGEMDVTGVSIADVPVHWSHVRNVRCGSLVGIERRPEGLKVWLELNTGELEDRALALVDLGRVGLSAGFNARMTTLRAAAITGQRRAERMRLGEVSLTETPAFGLADTAVTRVADVPRFATEALRRERDDEHELRALESGALSMAAGHAQTRYYPGARIHVR
ncbi:hypothetical protein [Isoptericola sp. NPDC057191]|uniref:hypothetical protein n=1 Tax=Isoptericola sp. NPDC057191 TaxID=3346041 RepID=UPI0036286F72